MQIRGDFSAGVVVESHRTLMDRKSASEKQVFSKSWHGSVVLPILITNTYTRIDSRKTCSVERLRRLRSNFVLVG